MTPQIPKLLPVSARAIAGQTAERLRAIAVSVLTAAQDKRSLNVGGGPWFAEPGWHNLEEVASVVNRRPYHLDPKNAWPFDDSRFERVLASHVFEHLTSDTAARVVLEAYRTLAPGGTFVICIPDFDRALRCWRSRDSSFFIDEYWDYSQVSHTWKSRNVPDTLDHRAAFLFCGFWNAEYGHPFKREFYKNDRAYYGPPPLPADVLRRVSEERTPHELSDFLRRLVVANEADTHFSHQNAWSRSELTALCESAGFRVESVDTATVVDRCADFPRIRQRMNRSTYCLAIKP